ncbi:MAG: terpene cyclase/mutase family protein [Actinobacteria bacterium]|nr:terpene cyclase/mutase family protein [Actinomycetota bacterium]
MVSLVVGGSFTLLSLVGSGVIGSGVVGRADVAAPTSTSVTPAVAARAAASWSARRLAGGDHVEGLFGPDIGLTADVVLGLAAAGVERTAAQAAGDWLAGQAQGYVDGGVPGDVSAGSAAKLALVAEALGRDPATFGALDLDATLRGRMAADGRFTDSLDFGGPTPVDQSNTFTQSLAILALRPSVPTRAVTFLAGQRCPDGGFPVFYPEPGAVCGSDVDGTGIVVQALLADGATTATGPAVAWLAGQQAADGSFSSGGPGSAPNSNSTALAAQALRTAGETAAADRAVGWLLTRQVGCEGTAADRGAVGYLDPIVDDSALRATAQAVPALAGVSLADLDGAVPDASAAAASIPCAAAGPAPTATRTPSPARTVTATVTVTATGSGPAPATAAAAAPTSTTTSPPLTTTPTITPTTTPTPSQPTPASSTTAAGAPAAGPASTPAQLGSTAAAAEDRPLWQRLPAGWGLAAAAVAAAGWMGLLVGQRRPRQVPA